MKGPPVCRDKRGKPRCRHQNYGLTCNDFELPWQRAGGCCEICGIGEQFTPAGILFIDHDATAGPDAVRGLLCNTCNSRLHEDDMAGPWRDRYLANAWHRSRARSGPPELGPWHHHAARCGLRAAGIGTYISGPAIRAIIAGLASHGYVRGTGDNRLPRARSRVR